MDNGYLFIVLISHGKDDISQPSLRVIESGPLSSFPLVGYPWRHIISRLYYDYSRTLKAYLILSTEY